MTLSHFTLMTPEGLASRKALLIGWDAADWESLGGLAFGIRGIARLAQAEANARELGRLANKRVSLGPTLSDRKFGFLLLARLLRLFL
jgi:hypothetical protein